MPPATGSTPTPALRARVLWGALVLMLLVAQSLLVWLTLDYESGRAQDRAAEVAAQSAGELRRQAQQVLESVQVLVWTHGSDAAWRTETQALLRERHALLRLERRDDQLHLLSATDTPYGPTPFSAMSRRALELELAPTCAQAVRTSTPTFSRSYFMPLPGGQGQEVVDLCFAAEGGARFVVATVSLPELLERVAAGTRGEHELSLVEPDGTRLARAGNLRGQGVYQATRLVSLPGLSLLLRADAVTGRPGLIPNLAIALVLGLSLSLLGVVGLLVRDIRRRSAAEHAVAEALAFRRAMEDSLVTGLRARDRDGRITYVNPAFCAMVGWEAEALVGQDTPPYWPPERVDDYRRRQAERLQLGADDNAQRQGFETQFMRRNGERFPVMIYEAPLRDREGHHTGWMSAAVDVSGERRMEELSRQQQERLQASARLATVGEMASLLSHELNQPLAAIASYATGSLNLMDAPDEDPAELKDLLRQALTRIAEQAERAGRVIKSVHGFVRRRDGAREALAADQLIEAVLPLVRLQARKSGTRIEVTLARPVPRVWADRTMVEQVLLNLTRNGIQAMDEATPAAERVLHIEVVQTHPRWVRFTVRDAGPGIPPEVAARLFTPFFTTKTEGMGLGLSLCRTVIEQHGGALDFGPPPGEPAGRGTEFRFTLPVPETPVRKPTDTPP
ncbi:two-component system sensor histidine kinase NtrB [Ideonella alba]|uniref:histidine kinase n=1 Tax=Ideonella alba TaxID=2824118 RepID=A0A940YEP7_9BURK|nr:ATP-binding protein [Ideonella alba]MBQ0933190.1 PAS domain S-box protein [Ideonella alba]